MTDQTSYKAIIHLPRDEARTVANALSELYWPPAGVVGLFDNEDGSWRVEATFHGKPDEKNLIAFLQDQVGKDITVTFEDVPDKDWVSITQARLHPVRAGRFVIHGSHDREHARGSRWAVEIDAAQAFGTAHHGSTLGCLEAIDDLAKREEMKSVLDIGTGTGVLAIASARAWRANVRASDIDPVATSVAGENVIRNGVQAYVRTITATGLEHAHIRSAAPYDLVIANILARPLTRMAHGISRALRPGGVVILSGITREQAGRVAAAYRAVGFTRLRQFANSEWVTLTLRR